MTRIRNREALLNSALDERGRARRALALDLFEAALVSVDPFVCTQRALRALKDQGALGGSVTLFAFGKAARGMAEAALAELPIARGIVIGFEEGTLGPLTLFRGGHPVPADDAPAHGSAMLSLARSLHVDDVALVLVSGGGSALLEVPGPDLTLADLQETTRVLLASGASIREVNVVRSALSAVKGGKLARAIAPARVVNVVLSDVIGSPLPSIASGPTVAPVTVGDTPSSVVARYQLETRLSTRVLGALATTAAQNDSFDHVTSVIAADNLTAQQAMLDGARALGHRTNRREAYVDGEASVMGPRLLAEARALGTIYIAGGETTVTLGPDPGRGGRNQELVLSAYAHLDGALIASLGTDGIDGESDAAGAMLDGELLSRATSLGLDPSASLARHDSGSWLSSAGASLETGRTGTNVADLCLVLP